MASVTVQSPVGPDADSQPEVQAAIDACAARGGGTVFLPEGVYTIGKPGQPTPSLFLSSGITFRGSGSATILRRAAGGYASPLIFNRGRTTTTGGTGRGDTGIVIADLSIDGRKGSATQFASNEQAIWLSLCKNSFIDRVWAYDHRTNGITLEYSQDINITNCVSYGNMKNGFYLSGCDRIALVGCSGYGNGSPGIAAYRIGSTFSIAASYDCTLSACRARGDVGASLLSGRDTRYLNVVGGNYADVDVSTESIGNWPPEAPPRPPYEPGVTYGTSLSQFVALAIHGAGYHGLRLIKGGGNLVSDCVIRDIALNGIFLHGSAANVVRGNIVANVGRAGNRDYATGICVIADSQVPDGHGNRIDGNLVADDCSPCTTLRGVAVIAQGDGRLGRPVVARNVVRAPVPLYLPGAVASAVQQDDNAFEVTNQGGGS